MGTGNKNESLSEIALAPLPNETPAFEQVVEKIPNLDAFLARKDLVDAYFRALQKYYGAERFTYDSFNTIFKQLIRIKDHARGLKERLWETTGLGESFSIATGIKTYGRAINQGKWDAYFGEWMQRLTTIGSPILRLSEEGRAFRLEQILASFESQVKSIQAFEKSNKHSQTLKANFFKVLRNNEDLRAAAAYILLSEIRFPPVTEALNSGDPDIILDTLERLKLEQRAWFTKLGLQSASLVSHVKSLIPDLKEVLSDEKLFPRETYQTNNGKVVPLGRSDIQIFRFEPIPRRIHGIWKGATVMDCVGGSPGFLDDTTPERWAVSALKDTQVYHIERFLRSSGQFTQREYAGFVQVVPQCHRDTGMLIGSVEFMSHVLFRKAVTDTTNGKMLLVNLFDLWLKESTKRLPKNWIGFAIGESNALNYLGVLNQIRKLPQYLFGRREPSSNFEHIDALGKEIPSLMTRHGAAKKYGGNMIFDAKVPDARFLTILNTEVSTGTAETSFKTGMVELMRSPDPMLRWRAALATLNQDSENREALVTVVANLELTIRNFVEIHIDSVVDLVKRKSAELLDNHPYKLSEGDLWVESIVELTRWFVRRKDLVANIDVSVEPPTVNADSTLEQLGLRAAYLLRRALTYGRTQEVRVAAIKAFGILRWRDPALTQTIAKIAKPSRIHFSLRVRTMSSPLRDEALFALGEMGWDHPDAILAITEVLKYDYPDTCHTELLAIEALEKLRSSDMRLVRGLKSALSSDHKAIRIRAAEVLESLGYLSNETIAAELAKATLKLDSALPHEKITAVGTLMRSQQKDRNGLVKTLETQLAKESNPNVRSKIVSTLIDLNIPNMWTVSEMARRTPEQGLLFISRVLKEQTNSGRIRKAMKEASRIDSSPLVAQYVARFEEQLKRYGTGWEGQFFGQLRSYVTDVRIVGLSIVAIFGIYNLKVWYGNIQDMNDASRREYKTQTIIVKLQEIQLFNRKVRLLTIPTEDGFYSAVLHQQRLIKPTVTAFRSLKLNEEENTLVREILAHSDELEADSLKYFQAKSSGVGVRPIRDNEEEKVQKLNDLIWSLKWANYEALIKQLRNRANIEFYYFHIVDAIGNIILFLLSVMALEFARRDTKRRLNAELLLRDNEERFEVLLSNIKDYATFTVSADGTVTSWHPAAQLVFGYSPDEIIGQNFSIFYTKKDIKRGAPQHDLKAAKAGGKHADDKMQVTKIGNAFFVHQVIVPLRDDREGVRGFVFIVKALSETEAAQARSEDDAKAGESSRPLAA
jgi:PAS domain S-box-containing protein